MTAPAAQPRSFIFEDEEYVGVPAAEFPEFDLEVELDDVQEGETRFGITRSQNGWTANDRSVIVTYTVPGTTTKLALRKGAAGYLQCHFWAWFDKNIESIDGGQLDDWGYAERTVRGSSDVVSNHASGTASDGNALKHPMGKSNTFTAAQQKKIRAQLAKYEGCLRWGGDYQSRPDDMHIEVNKNATECARVARKLRTPPAHRPGSRTLRFSNPRMSGADVAWLQRRLNSLGNKLVVNGIYDQATAQLVDVFQRNRDFDEAGCGPKTWDKLGA